ncbi:hypothetical protein LEUCIP111803_02116 [Leucobacter soli]|uniref:HTH luxR-type domain-containing protein n=1 Tax=Leucobacter soli TaxID=2812850 RepID=A0A916NI06_9MICO|nr:hypothetical protein LEUCIP111803_02116 [Leucobacter soli]
MRQRVNTDVHDAWVAGVHTHRFSSTTPERIDELTAVLAEAGSSVLLIGEPGSGKSRIAQEVAYSLGDRIGEQVSVTVLLRPSHPMHGIAALLGLDLPALFEWDPGQETRHEDPEHPQQAVQRILQELSSRADGGLPVLVAAGIDEYPPVTAYLFDQLIRSRRIRVIATAHRLTGAAALISSDPRTVEMPIRPFTVEESGRYLQQILASDSIENRTLLQWHRLTRGNAYSLLLLTVALQQHGRIGRHRGVVWELPGDRTVPEEFAEHLVGTCSAEEMATLEVIALAEPLVEAGLLQLLDPDAVTSLRRRGLVVSRTMHNGAVALSLDTPVIREALREQMPAPHRIEVVTRIFEALLQESGTDPQHSPERILRLVIFGIEAERPLPFDWLWLALEARESIEEARWLRIALIVARHPEATAVQSAIAALLAGRIARVLGDPALLADALELAGEAAGRLRRATIGVTAESVALELELVDELLFELGDAEAALGRLDELDGQVRGQDQERVEAVAAARAYAMACAGELRQADALCADTDPHGSMRVECARSRSRLVSAIVRIQEGRYTEAMLIAENARHLAVYGLRPMEEADLLGFVRFLAIWSSGSVEASRVALEEFEETALPGVVHSGLTECGRALLRLAEGRWRLAAQEAERLQDRLAEHDVHGLRPLVRAVLALACAALGEREESVREIREAERNRPGLSSALLGILRLLTLRARQWNYSADLTVCAKRLAAWAAEQGLAAIELQALHVGAMSNPFEFERMVPRLRVLARQIDLPLGVTVLAHVEEFVSQAEAWDSPSARTLSELGIWAPLPPTSKLSAREREIALLASLGYSSKWIAEQFHLSVRTVETHLRHVFTKLGASNRDELRVWFRKERQPA